MTSVVHHTLRIFIDHSDPELKALYQKHIEKHNASLETDPFPNAGFDLFVPEETTFYRANLFQTHKIDSCLQTEMVSETSKCSVAYCLYARSSISKTPLMLANHVGIVDSGYRGHLIGAVRCLYMESEKAECYVVEKFTRLFQICLPTLEPFHVEMVEDVSDLSLTIRGSGGFGSTGLVGISV